MPNVRAAAVCGVGGTTFYWLREQDLEFRKDWNKQASLLWGTSSCGPSRPLFPIANTLWGNKLWLQRTPSQALHDGKR
jgi:hypothetical protein